MPTPPSSSATRPNDVNASDPQQLSFDISQERRVKGFRLPLVAGIVLLAVGLGAAGYGFFESVITDILAARSQGDLTEQFEARAALAATPDAVITREDFLAAVDQTEAIDDPTMAAPPEFDDPDDVPVLPRIDPEQSTPLVPSVSTPWIYEAPPAQGEPLGRIVIPQADVDWIIVEGVEVVDLRKGPGHMPNTAIPGQLGNAVISGHRTTYGAPFFHLDRLQPGDRFTVETVIGVHTFEVVESRIVEPTDVWVTGQWEGAWLTLTTCSPLYSARQRLIVFSKLVDGPNADSVEAQYDGTYVVPTPGS